MKSDVRERGSPVVINDFYDFRLEYDFFDLSCAGVDAIYAQRPGLTPPVTNGCTDHCLTVDPFGLSYAVLSQLKPNFDFVQNTP